MPLNVATSQYVAMSQRRGGGGVSAGVVARFSEQKGGDERWLRTDARDETDEHARAAWLRGYVAAWLHGQIGAS